MKPSSDQLKNKNVLVVKLETTGTTQEDEILELCVLDARDPWQGGSRTGAPKPLFHARFHPAYKEQWPEAMRVNGITPEMVAGADLLDDRRSELVGLFTRCDCLVCYNAGFDFPFLRRQFVFKARVMTVDLMRDWTDYVTMPRARDQVCMNVPFLPQKDMFRHFQWQEMSTPVAQCLGLRHCFLQLIKAGAIRIRRPLMERRFSRMSEAQLNEVQEDFTRALGTETGGPVFSMTQDGEDVVVTLGVSDPQHLFYSGDAPLAKLTVPGTGAAREVRERIAKALEKEAALPSGLVELACRVLRSTDEKKDNEPA